MSFNITNLLPGVKKIFSNNVMITVVIIDNSSSQEPQLVVLNLTDNLLTIRKELEKDYTINDTLSFSRKYFNNNNYEFAEIAPEKEEKFRLDDIVDKSDKSGNVLYLKKCSKINWSFLNNLRKLDYGCTMAFDEIRKAKKRAFIMKDCELTEIGAEGCRKGFVEFGSNEDQMMKTNLFFSADINVRNFVKLGMSIGSSKNEKFSSETSSSYYFTKYGKTSLKFNELEPAQEFIKVVEDAINSKDPESFRQITEEFGQFIPTEIILGGRAYFNKFNISIGHSAENSKEDAMDIDTEFLSTKVENTSNCLEERSNYYNSKCTKLIGGKPPNNLENFDEETWVKSLEDYKNWDSIEYRNPVSIFQLLPDDLRKRILISVGKRIHHVGFNDYNYHLEEFGSPHIFELKEKIPPNILKIIQNKDADCNIFATIIDTESKKDFFTCQVFCPLYPDKKPKPCLLIHCIQKKFKRRECKLKIGWMVIGYHTDFNFILPDYNAQLDVQTNDFNMLNNQTTMINTALLSFDYIGNVPPCLGIPVLTKLDSSNESLVIGHHFFNAREENKIGACTFSYCLKKNHHVNLPNFTFHTLIISNYHTRNAYDIIPFVYSRIKKKSYIDFNNNITGSCFNPKFISLYSTQKTNCGTIFLKQKNRQIKIKSINCKNKTCICKNNILKISENNIKCTFFDPYIRGLSPVIDLLLIG